jgi:P-type conjugative transfer protein TrbJ
VGEAKAQFAVFDPTNYAENVLHYARALEQLRAAQAQIANQVQALKKLRDPRWRSLVSTVGRLNDAMASRSGVGYALADPASALRSVYPGDRATSTYVADERSQTEHAMATMAAALTVAHAQGATLEPGVRQVDAFKQQAASVQGHEAALELGTSVGVFSAEELVLLRQAMASQTNMQAVAYARQVTADAQAEENTRTVLGTMAAGAPRRPPMSLRFAQ